MGTVCAVIISGVFFTKFALHAPADHMLFIISIDRKSVLYKTGKDAKVRGLAAPSNLSMNQTLEGHTGKF